MKAYTIQIRLSDLDTDLLTKHLRAAKDRYKKQAATVEPGLPGQRQEASLLLRSVIRCIKAIEEEGIVAEEDREYFS